MGRASKWFRSFFSYLKSPDSRDKNKRGGRPSLPASGDPLASPYAGGIDANRHAIAVAAATAAVAEAALTAAQAAAEVVRLTSGGRSGRGAPGAGGYRRTVTASVKIQSAFRAYLARRALRALKGLVKLQALVRGHIVRKQSADMLRRMHAMARIQARASAHRSYPPESPYAKNASNSHHPGVANPRRYEERSKSAVNGGSLIKPDHSRSNSGISTNKENSQIASRWLNHWMEQCAWEKSLHEASLDKRSDKILEVDTWKPHPNKARPDRVATTTSNYFSAWNEPRPEYATPGPASRASSKHHKPNPSVSSEEDQAPTCRPGGNPSFTPARSECSRSVFGDYVHPSYMANTESSRAKVRSYSAPKQRMGLGASGDFWECSDSFSERDSPFPERNHRCSGQMKRQGTPARDGGVYVRRM